VSTVIRTVPTMRMVAAAAGVGLKTVSRVVNGEPNVSPEIAERVHDAIRRSGFRPNALARSLATGSSRTLALVLPNISNPFHAGIYSGVEAVASENEYTVILGGTAREAARLHKYLDLAISRRVEGVVLVGLALDGAEVSEFEKSGAGIVYLDCDAPGATGPSVHFDQRQVGKVGARHLVDLGRRAIAFISGPEGLPVSDQRVAGFRSALKAQKVPYDHHLVVHGDFTLHGGYAATRQLIEKHRFDGLLAANDLMAVGALAALAESGLTVPDDVAVVGMDDIELAKYTRPALTTVKTDSLQLGRIAAELMFRSLQGLDVSLTDQQLGAELVIRATA
jgi:LacI family transcriptional regulator